MAFLRLQLDESSLSSSFSPTAGGSPTSFSPSHVYSASPKALLQLRNSNRLSPSQTGELIPFSHALAPIKKRYDSGAVSEPWSSELLPALEENGSHCSSPDSPSSPRVKYHAQDKSPKTRSTSPTPEVNQCLHFRRVSNVCVAPSCNSFAVVDFYHDHLIDSAYRFLNTMQTKSGVTEARNKSTGKSVAVKVISKADLGSAVHILELKTEIKVWIKATHNHLVHLIDAYEDDHQIHLIMELMQSGTLEDRLKSGHLTEEKARHIFSQLLSAVTYFHCLGIVRTSLRPSEIFFSDSNNVKVTAFFLGKYSNKPTPVEWAAPETLARGGPRQMATFASIDMWCLGVTLYTMLCGSPPFQETENCSRAELFDKVKNADFSFASPVWSTVSAEGKDLICKLIFADSSQRFVPADVLRHSWMKNVNLETSEKKSIWQFPRSHQPPLVYSSSQPQLINFDESFEQRGRSSSRLLSPIVRPPLIPS